jgi:anthraniloyl-CoA monooxygenase
VKIVILGAGPAGLYSGLLIKKADPLHDITIIERNPADVTYGWGVVFSDRTLASFQLADYKTYEQIASQFVIWDAIDVTYRDETIRCGGHIIASIARKLLLNILQRRCAELGITLLFNHELQSLADIGDYDLLIAADGINSLVRRTYAGHFKPGIVQGTARYIWLGAEKALDTFTFIFRENEHGLFEVHAYPFNGTTSTFIIECEEQTWLKSGLEGASEAESMAYCERLLARDLDGARLLSNNSRWISFATLKTQNWHYGRIVLLGDAAHTAHFSIGSGTKLAMEDAIALASALEQHSDLETALNAYELERKPVIELFQRASRQSQYYFETASRYLRLDPMQFTFNLLTRSGRITYNDLKLRDARFGDAVDRRFSRQDSSIPVMVPWQPPMIAPPPMFTPLSMRATTLPNRVALVPRVQCAARDGLPDSDYPSRLIRCANAGAGLIIVGPVAVSAEGRITPECPGMYSEEHLRFWAETVQTIHTHSSARIGIVLNHAGRRGATQPRAQGMDLALHNEGWPLLSASPLPYTPRSQVPREMQRADMEHVRDNFIRAARMAQQAGFDLLQLHFAHGYLLASFLSPLTNRRGDEYGGDFENRARFPVEVFDAVRKIWPQEKPLSVVISASDCVRGGATVEDAIALARILRSRGCDIVSVQAGQTTPEGVPKYGRGFLTPYSDRVRNEAGIATIVGGYLTTSDEVNTILAGGRADLCIMEPPDDNQSYMSS